jgi:hypothetical protein
LAAWTVRTRSFSDPVMIGEVVVKSLNSAAGFLP